MSRFPTMAIHIRTHLIHARRLRSGIQGDRMKDNITKEDNHLLFLIQILSSMGLNSKVYHKIL
ncbi:hypothetical protein KSF78_0003956 [Schistosoma japonicum]|nr:hypothetical protein KSF78_0003956 [Schistosoma japonicum]